MKTLCAIICRGDSEVVACSGITSHREGGGNGDRQGAGRGAAMAIARVHGARRSGKCGGPSSRSMSNLF